MGSVCFVLFLILQSPPLLYVQTVFFFLGSALVVCIFIRSCLFHSIHIIYWYIIMYSIFCNSFYFSWVSSSVSFLILVIWIFSLFSIRYNFVNFVELFKKKSFGFIDFPIVNLFFLKINFCINLYFSFFLSLCII